ncbi:MAG: hypothetical protein EOM24_04405, partial [Chloroflexia bacterium]|nr:hypothetical protein [Chloroflexia bacterium]
MSVDFPSSSRSTTGNGQDQLYRMTAIPEGADWSAEPQVTAPEARTRPKARPPRRRGRMLIVALVALLLLTVIGTSTGLYFLNQSYDGRIYPNVSIRGVQVGELTVAEAEEAIQARFASFLAQPVVLTYGDQAWMPTMAELGVRIETE